MTANQPTTATAPLRQEHKLILEVAHALAGELVADGDGDRLDYESVARFITFFRLFVDACHHGQEEDLLFPGLEARGLPKETGPIAVMLDEHARGRALVRDMAASLEGAQSGDLGAAAELRVAAEGLAGLIVAHIDKEDNILFNMADGLIVGPDCVDLCARYDEVCRRRFDGQTKQDLERLGREILQHSRRPSP